MLKLDWHEPNVISQKNFSIASDTSTANIYLLRKKYNIEVAEWNEILFRRYNGANINRNGYGFPLSDKNFDLHAAKICDFVFAMRLNAPKFYPEAKYLPITTENLPVALNIAEKWLSEHDSDDISLQNEQFSIHEAADNWEKLGMRGGILYADGEPAAMIIFSFLNEQCIDAHFEKSANKFAQVGASATIKKFMASVEENSTYKYINFEEDVGIIGLKRAKESYRLYFKIKKYYGEVF